MYQKISYAAVLRNYYRKHTIVLGTLRVTDSIQAYISALSSIW